MPYDYHITFTMDDGSQGKHCGTYRHGWEAAERAIDLFPDAQRIDVLRSATVQQRMGAHPQRQPQPGASA